MLIYEPKKYPDLNPNIGDTVYDYLTGKELGKVSRVDYNMRWISFNGGQFITHISGLSSPTIDPTVSVKILYECYTWDIITSCSIKTKIRIKC
jgi:hypothetical protein